ncbi:MAG: hypothetical protein R3C11_06750 [Planctomycetaceae bacterium]
MSQDQHALVKEIFLQASELTGKEREEFLKEACAGDKNLRDSVISLLKNDSPETILTGLSDSIVDKEQRG